MTIEMNRERWTQEEHFFIDPALSDLLPRTGVLEEDLLEEQLVIHGSPNDSLVVWEEENLLVDGHRRYAVCKKHGLAYSIRKVSFADMTTAIRWMLSFQLGRRNLLDHDKAIFVKRLKDTYAKDRSSTESVKMVSELVNQSPRTTWRQLSYEEAVDKMTPEWQEAIADRLVKVPRKYAESIATLPDDEQDELLNNTLIAGTSTPMKEKFPDPPAKSFRKFLPKPEKVPPMGPIPEGTLLVGSGAPVEISLVLLGEAENKLGIAAKSFDKLFGIEGLNTSSSHQKRIIDQGIRDIAMTLQHVRDRLTGLAV